MSIAATWDGLSYVCTPVPEPVPVSTLIPYSQRDPRWASLVYAGGTTFGASGCLVVSIAMLVSLAYAERIEPPEVAAGLRAAGCFSGNLLSNPAKIPAAFPRLTWDGVLHYRDRPADMAVVAREIAANGATIAEVAFDPAHPVTWVDAAGVTHFNQHFVVLTRVVDNDCEIADPWTGALTLLTESRYYLNVWPKRASRVITGLRLVGTLGG